MRVPHRTPRPLSRKLITASVALAVVGGAAYGLTLIPGPPTLDFSTPTRRYLHPIPINRGEACTQVAVIHLQLSAFEGSYQSATLGLDTKAADAAFRAVQNGTPPSSLQPPAWPVVKVEVDGAAQALDGALATAIPDFPPRIRRELTIVRSSIDEGMKPLPKIDSADAFRRLTFRAHERGQLHAGYASDLVGRQCPVRLGA